MGRILGRSYMKTDNALIIFLISFCLFSGCARSVVIDLKSDTMKGGPAIVCDDRKFMYVTFANPTTADWTLDVNNALIKSNTEGTINLIWEENQYQKEHDALGFKVYRVDGKFFEPEKYTFKMLIDNKGVQQVFEGEFKLSYRRAIPIVLN